MSAPVRRVGAVIAWAAASFLVVVVLAGVVGVATSLGGAELLPLLAVVAAFLLGASVALGHLGRRLWRISGATGPG